MKSLFFQQYVPQFAHVKLACIQLKPLKPPRSITGVCVRVCVCVSLCARVCVCVCVCLGGEGSERIWNKCEKGKGKEVERRLSASVMNSPSSFVHG